MVMWTLKDSEDKRLNLYSPLVKEEEKSRISSILKTETLLESKMEKGLENWRKKYLDGTRFYYYKKFSEDTHGEAEISIEEASKIILEGPSTENFSLSRNEETSRYFSKEDSSLETEKKPETISIPKIETFLDNSDKSNEVSLEEVASKTAKLERLTHDFQDKCVVCGFSGRMDWQVTEFDDCWGVLCENCGDKLAKKLGAAGSWSSSRLREFEEKAETTWRNPTTSVNATKTVKTLSPLVVASSPCKKE